MSDELTDDELINRYVCERQDSDFRVLVERHHDRLFSRFMGEVRDKSDAMDLEQQLWLKVFRNLQNYKTDGLFSHYLSRIATNLLNDHWRKRSNSRECSLESHIDERLPQDKKINQHRDMIETESGTYRDVENVLATDELVTYLVSVLIPQLPVKLRTVWLLRHESEYWDPDCRLDWQHLADLNGSRQEDVWGLFESARNKLLKRTHFANSANQATSTIEGTVEGAAEKYAGIPILSDEELLVYTVWTQAQRLRKEQQFTWEYFSELLNIPENTLKTRYRSAQKLLNDGLQAWINAKPDINPDLNPDNQRQPVDV